MTSRRAGRPSQTQSTRSHLMSRCSSRPMLPVTRSTTSTTLKLDALMSLVSVGLEMSRSLFMGLKRFGLTDYYPSQSGTFVSRMKNFVSHA